MIIERVLHVRGSKMDFYSSSYFEGNENPGEEKPTINPFVLSEGKLYAYGLKWNEVTKDFDIPIVVDLRKAAELLKASVFDITDVTRATLSPCYSIAFNISETWDDTYIALNKTIGELITVEHPPVPPSLVRVSDSILEHDTKYMDLWLGQYGEENVPSIIHPRVQVDCNPYEIDGEDVVFSFRQHVVKPRFTLPIVNGFACFPEVRDASVVAKNAAAYFGTPSDRNRQAVLVDFERVGGCEFHRMSDLVGDITEFQLPESYDEKYCSVLTVVDGRLLTQDDYDVFGGRVHVNPVRLTVLPELDRKICCGETISNNTRIVAADGKRDLYHAPNSFVVIVNKPGLQIVEHDEWFKKPEETQTTDTSSYFCCDKHWFDQLARGLLYERNTRSVYDYVMVPETSTFYAEENGGVPEHEEQWKTAIVTINVERPMAIVAGSRHNLMSAQAMLFDRARSIASDDRVIWHKFALLDLIFRG